jgi:hypothetical protein
MATASRFNIILCMLCALVSGCVNTRVEYFTDNTYPSRPQSEPAQWLSEPPTRPYHEVARVTVTSTAVSEERLRQSLLDRAGKLGADAVIPERPMVIMSPAPTPFYERGILGPMGAGFGWYGYGWYTPYSSNPYLLVQGAVDQPRIERSLSGMAIRYDSGEQRPPSQRATAVP